MARYEIPKDWNFYKSLEFYKLVKIGNDYYNIVFNVVEEELEKNGTFTIEMISDFRTFSGFGRLDVANNQNKIIDAILDYEEETDLWLYEETDNDSRLAYRCIIKAVEDLMVKYKTEISKSKVTFFGKEHEIDVIKLSKQ